MKCGLLGKTLSHSYSPQIHEMLSNYTYQLFEKTPEEVSDFILNGEYTGLNVTIPYKKDVIPYCNELSERAAKLGAVNTIVRRKDGTIIGHNTDYFGFQSMVHRIGANVEEKKALVLGSGGASATAVYVLQEMGANVIVISRNGENNYQNLHLHKDASLIVNATPVGMYPNNGQSPLNISIFPHLEGVLDMIYNPSKTKLLLDAESRGIPTENGLWMLVAQAKESAEWFTGEKIHNDVIGSIHKKLKKQMQNIILIGMPGCGKSTIGKQLAAQTGKKFIDADEEIVKIANMSIPDIFTKFGEPYFREYETKVLTALGKQSGLVIATGGGCVTRNENYALLHQNSIVYWLQRDITSLPTDGRPLSQINKLEDMYAVRKPLYQYFADYTIPNDSTIVNAVDLILKGWDAQ